MLDPAALERAVVDADLVVLLSSLVHLTGDASLLDRYDTNVFDHGRRPATLSETEADGLRSLAVDRLAGVDPSAALARPPISGELLHRIMTFCAGEEIGPEYDDLVRNEANFSGDDPRRFAWTQPPDADEIDAFHVAVIGAGLGGLCAAIRLEQAGIPYTVFDKNPQVGGTWFENTYPDLRVDVPNHFYSYSFAPNPDWSHYYAERAELAAYIERCAADFGILPHIRFDSEVLAADFDDDRSRWALHIRTDGAGGTDERVEANAVISAVGLLNRPSIPDVEGRDTFAGPAFHSSRWDHEVDLTGRRVAVVGTGASAMQFVPAIAPDVDELLVFQRSRHWITPNPAYHRTVSDSQQWLFANVPFYAGWYRFLQFWNSADRIYPAFRVDPEWSTPDISISLPNEKLRRVVTGHLEAELADAPELVEQVLPDYPPLGKRMLQDNGWFRALKRDNVTLVNERIAGVTEHSVVTTSGQEHDIDVIVWATGFHPNKFLWPMDVTARGVSLHDVWGEDPRAYLGITVPGFPNLFCLYGPNTNPVVGSVIFMLECQVDYVIRCLGALIEGGYASMECRQDVHDEYNARVDAEHEQMIWRHPKVHSYYNNAAGRVTTNAPWRLIDYWRMTKSPALADYVLRTKELV
jgi:4-hydroxyacetophenone monooxygenase